ncbi:uncharacterized protein LOC143542343 [Bidens hawaiensis]|uniref:uncharacterized protein LOC143542343 n=1 Tax=Bidens hawaiensis TaxID=980011 RepID=UPI0040499669
MASTCMSTCIADDARVSVRATYTNLYKWPDSDREFVRSVSKNSHHENEIRHPRVVDSISCRQLYLRSYKFSRKESLNERTMKCIGRVKERASVRGKPDKTPKSGDRRPRDGGKRKRRKEECTMVMKAKEASWASLASIFRRLLSCTTKVDVVD